MRLKILVCLFLLGAVLAVYSQVSRHGFVNYDVGQYILDNHHVRTGLRAENIAWAFTATRASNWHPLTWLSHMTDCQLFGLDAGKHHLVNLAFHAANVLLLFLVLSRMTGAPWRSGFVAALFGIHPLAVESVAWVAERKDVLFAFFWIAAMGAYARYAEKPGFLRYLPVVFLFALGLMSKPMIVTLPCVLLLLDVWPLCRLGLGQSCPKLGHPRPDFGTSGAGVLVLEKLPLFALAAASVGITVYLQQKGGAVGTLESYPLADRIGNAVVSYSAYLRKMVLPTDLSVFYPYRSSVSAPEIIGSALFIAAATAFAAARIRKTPWVAVGWFWFLGTLLPVIGIVQVGMQAMADRYAYVTLIGIYILAAWGVPALIPEHRLKKTVLAAAGVLVVTVFAAMAHIQVGYWKNGETLFTHAASVTEGNFVAHNSLGSAFSEKGDQARAIAHYREAIRLNPTYAAAHNNLAIVYAKIGRLDAATSHFKQALGLYPDFPAAHFNLALALEKVGRTKDARRHFSEALRLMPDAVRVKNELSRIDIVMELEKDPDNPALHHRLARIRMGTGNPGAAVAHLEKALSVKPDSPAVMKDLGILHTRLGEFEKAVSWFEKLAGIDPESAPDAWYAVACIHARQHRADASVAALKKAVASGFDNPERIKTDENLANIRHTPYWRELANH